MKNVYDFHFKAIGKITLFQLINKEVFFIKLANKVLF